jgi:hypothetical protein
MLASGDPERVLAASILVNEQLDWERQQKSNAATAATRAEEQEQKEFLGLCSSIGKEMFSKDDFTDEEAKTIGAKARTVYAWMREVDPDTGKDRMGYSMKHAYKLMTMDEKLSEAKTKTAKGVVESLRKQPVGHVGGGPSQQAADNYEAMTEGQLSEVVGNMSDKDKTAFYEKASPALRKKYPSWPWD